MMTADSRQLFEDDYGLTSLSHRLSLLIGVDPWPPMLASLASQTSWATLNLVSENTSDFEPATYAHLSKNQMVICVLRARTFAGTFAQTLQVGMTTSLEGREPGVTRGCGERFWREDV